MNLKRIAIIASFLMLLGALPARVAAITRTATFYATSLGADGHDGIFSETFDLDDYITMQATNVTANTEYDSYYGAPSLMLGWWNENRKSRLTFSCPVGVKLKKIEFASSASVNWDKNIGISEGVLEGGAGTSYDTELGMEVASPTWFGDNPSVMFLATNIDGKWNSYAKVKLYRIVVTYDVPVVTEVAITPSRYKYLEWGQEFEFTATVCPTAALDKEVEWSLEQDDEYVEIISIVSSGATSIAKVAARKAGTANLVARAKANTYISDKVEIIVNPEPPSLAILPAGDIEMDQDSIMDITTILNPEGAPVEAVWSYNSSMVEIGPGATTGHYVLRGVGAGTTTITARYGDFTASKTVVVKAPFIPVSEIKITPDEEILVEYIDPDRTQALYEFTATVYPENANASEVEWSTQPYGKVTIVKVRGNTVTVTQSSTGTTTLIAKAKDGSGVQATAKLTCITGPVSDIKFLQDSIVVDEYGKEYEFEFETLPVNRTQPVTWQIEPKRIARIKAVEGKTNTYTVTGLKSGVAYATATTDNYYNQPYYEVSSKKPLKIIVNLPEAELVLNKTELELEVGNSFRLEAEFVNYPESEIDWYSYNPSVATIDSNGRITAKAPGTATIEAECGSLIATCKVTVVPLQVSSIYINGRRAGIVGESFTLTAECYPSAATDKKCVWSVVDESVASIVSSSYYDDQSHVTIKGLQKGETVLKAECGNISKEITLNICEFDDLSVKFLTLPDGPMKVGEMQKIYAILSPYNVGEVSYSSEDSRIASIMYMYANNTWYVGANGVGATTIKAYFGPVSAYYDITVVGIDAERVLLNRSEVTMNCGDSEQLTATVEPENVTDATVVWSSSDPDVAEVSAFGVVTAKSVGEAEITARCGEATAICVVTVLPISAESVTLNKTSLVLECGDAEQLLAEVVPSNATDQTIVWESSDASVAAVDESGMVTALAPGHAVISASCGRVQSTCDVEVLPVAASGLILNVGEISMSVGEEFVLTATVEPENVTDATVVWSSSDPDVAEVSAFGVVTAKSVGEAEITARCGDAAAVCVVTVLPISAESVTLNKTSLVLECGEAEQLLAEVLPSNATDQTIVWESSDASVAAVDESGMVTALAPGHAVISASCGRVQSTCDVEVLPVAASGLILNVDEISMSVGEEFVLTATVEPENATDATVVWSSSDPWVADVSAGGIVTAVAEGFATITASCGEVSATCIVNVSGYSGLEWLEMDSDGAIVVYDLLGLKIDARTVEDVKRLRPGFYIVNGRKVFIR